MSEHVTIEAVFQAKTELALCVRQEGGVDKWIPLHFIRGDHHVLDDFECGEDMQFDIPRYYADMKELVY